jgi:GWT1
MRYRLRCCSSLSHSLCDSRPSPCGGDGLSAWSECNAAALADRRDVDPRLTLCCLCTVGVCVCWSAQCLVSVFGSLHLLCAECIQPVSRRLLNASYVFWQLWLNLLILAAFQLLQFRSSGPQSPPLASSIDASLSRHALLFFLLSNLGTGAVNLSIPTLTADSATAVWVLLVYLHTVVLLVHAYAAGRHWIASTPLVDDSSRSSGIGSGSSGRLHVGKAN